MRDRLSPQLRFNPTTLPNQHVLAQAVGAKVCRKLCKFICLPICLRFGRYSPLGKAQGHLQGRAPSRYQNKANLHTKRSAPFAIALIGAPGAVRATAKTSTRAGILASTSHFVSAIVKDKVGSLGFLSV